MSLKAGSYVGGLLVQRLVKRGITWVFTDVVEEELGLSLERGVFQ